MFLGGLGGRGGQWRSLRPLSVSVRLLPSGRGGQLAVQSCQSCALAVAFSHVSHECLHSTFSVFSVFTFSKEYLLSVFPETFC